MTDSESEPSFGDALKYTGKWPIDRIRLLIQLRLALEAQFRTGKSKNLLWSQIYNKMKAADPTLSPSLKDVQKKYNNMMLTYKRIKSSAHNIHQTRWEFFDDFDDILSHYGDTYVTNEIDEANVHYVKTEKKFDDDSVSFSSDDGGTPSNYNVVIYNSKSSTPVVCHNETANGIEVKRIVVPPKEPVSRKRKLTPGKVSTKTESATNVPINDNSWFKEFMIITERKEQARHEQLLDLERKRIEIETKNMQILRELVDVVKEFVNK